MSVHTSGKFGDVQRKNQRFNCFWKGDSGIEEEEEEEYYDDDGYTKFVKSRMSEFSRGRLKVRMGSFGTCIGRYGPVDYC